MYTYSINVAIKGQHLFRVNGLDTIERARVVAEGLQRGFPDGEVTITKWTTPVGQEVR